MLKATHGSEDGRVQKTREFAGVCDHCLKRWNICYNAKGYFAIILTVLWKIRNPKMKLF